MHRIYVRNGQPRPLRRFVARTTRRAVCENAAAAPGRVQARRVEEGIASAQGKEATKSFLKLLKWIEESVEKSVWLAGPDYSLADIAAIPYMMRLEMLRLARLWDHKPAIAAWWERVKARPSFDTAISKWLRPQDWQRYEEMPDPWPDVSRNLAAG